MNKTQEALKLALESAYLAGFNDSAEGYNGEYPFRDYGGTPTKDRLWVFRRDEYIREALAEQPAQQQEPVAWIRWEWNRTGRKSLVFEKPVEMPLSEEATGVVYDPLYPSPPASKPWVGLTEQEHTDIAIQCGCMSADWVFYGATVERILKEKNS